MGLNEEDLFLEVGSFLMQSQVNSSVRGRHISFRLMAESFSGETRLIRMSGSCLELGSLAQRLAVRLGKVRKNRGERIACLFVEKWEGTEVEGSWARLPGREFVIRVNYCRAVEVAADEVATVVPPQSGEVVMCELQSERTKAGGWRAKIVGFEAVGPVVNSDQIPESYASGVQLPLKVYGIKLERGFAQFAWCSA